MATAAPPRAEAEAPGYKPYVSAAQRPAGLQAAVGPIADSDLFAILIFFGLGAVLYRVANR